MFTHEATRCCVEADPFTRSTQHGCMSCARAARAARALRNSVRRGYAASAVPTETVSYALSRASPSLHKDKSKLVLDKSFDLKQPFPVAQAAIPVSNLEVTPAAHMIYLDVSDLHVSSIATAQLDALSVVRCLIQAATSDGSNPAHKRTACRHSRDLWSSVYVWGAHQLRQVRETGATSCMSRADQCF